METIERQARWPGKRTNGKPACSYLLFESIRNSVQPRTRLCEDTIMKAIGPLVFALLAAVIVGGLLMALSPAESPEVVKEDSPAKVEPRPAAATKLAETKPSPEKREPREVREPRGQAISLVEAIGIAEKLGKGQAVKAERREKGFRIELTGAEGKSRIELSADGKVLDRRSEDER
jgi:hypothetical protein